MSPVRLAFDYDARASQPTACSSRPGYTVHASVDRSGRPVRLPARVKELFT